MSQELLVVVLSLDGTFAVFRNEGGAPIDVTDEYEVDVLEAGGFNVQRKVEVPTDG